MATAGVPSDAIVDTRSITLIPVGLKEAALDSPTFRSGIIHFCEQLDLVERWLQGYLRCINRIGQEISPFESAINSLLTQISPPTFVSEAVLDHDYTLLAVKQYGEVARAYWNTAFAGVKKMDTTVADPIRAFLSGSLQRFKDLKRSLDTAQRQLDNVQSRYASQTRLKEASSLREDSFQLHESRKAYLKASMDFGVFAPQVRLKLDRLLVNIVGEQWRVLQEPHTTIHGKHRSDIERVRAWSREMENGEALFLRELQDARKQIENNAESATRPSRDLEDYALDSPLVRKGRGPSGSVALIAGKQNARADKQGWLNLRSISGKPTRTLWSRRWFYIKYGIFGWLVQGTRSGGVEESDRIGVLLCNARAGNSDDRRFVFEVKTKDMTIVLQAETQAEMNDWISTFDHAKRKALDDPSSTESLGLGTRDQDPAFAISPPCAPEFAASAADSGFSQVADDGAILEKGSSLTVMSKDNPRSSFDSSARSRGNGFDTNLESSRDKLMSKLDLHRKSTNGSNNVSPASPGFPSGGIASLIASSHGSMPVGPGALPQPPETPGFRKVSAPLATIRELPSSSLAPNTLANPPAPTNLSAAAVVVNGDRGLETSRPKSSGGIPSGLLANVWGSMNWGYLNRLEKGEEIASRESTLNKDQRNGADSTSIALGAQSESANTRSLSLNKDGLAAVSALSSTKFEYPNYYPLQLKAQDAQFRLLFPNMAPEDRVVLVFKATWNPNEQQEFPGRVYVTAKNMFFYSNHCGMTMTTSIRLAAISEVTAATGRDWDILFLHLKNATEQSHHTRITIKTFLEPLKLLQRRLAFLTENAAGEQLDIQEIMKNLIKMEQEGTGSETSIGSWENISAETPLDKNASPSQYSATASHVDLIANLHVDRGLHEYVSGADKMKKASKPFKLPNQPVVFVPSSVDELVVEKEFDVSPKALFHIMFGDRSAVWQLLYHERQAQRICQGPWSTSKGVHLRREFNYEIEYLDILRRLRSASVVDHQVIESAKEHLLYCVSDRKTPWHLPHRDEFILLTKVIITHVAKTKCKLALYTKVEWLRQKPPFAYKLIRRAALQDMRLDALDLADVLSEQVRRLIGSHSRTKNAIVIFGEVGQQIQTSEFAGNSLPLNTRLRQSRHRRTLTTLMIQIIGSFAETLATSLFQIIVRCLRWVFHTINTNQILLVVLLMSTGANLFSFSSGTSQWWQERTALMYMKQLGITSDFAMHKAVSLHDIQTTVSSNTSSSSSSSSSSVQLTQASSICRDQFDAISNMRIPHQSGRQGSLQSLLIASRLQESRQVLGSRRHDLMVAMRMINRIEQEMVDIEWHRWLREENAKCNHLEDLLDAANANRLDHKPGTADFEKISSFNIETILDWKSRYCGSCRNDTRDI